MQSLIKRLEVEAIVQALQEEAYSLAVRLIEAFSGLSNMAGDVN